jgi:hypothetical protein
LNNLIGKEIKIKFYSDIPGRIMASIKLNNEDKGGMGMGDEVYTFDGFINLLSNALKTVLKDYKSCLDKEEEIAIKIEAIENELIDILSKHDVNGMLFNKIFSNVKKIVSEKRIKK